MSELVADCKLGRTELTIFPPPSDPLAAMRLEADAARLAVLKHYSAEGCGCTAELRRRYGLVGSR